MDMLIRPERIALRKPLPEPPAWLTEHWWHTAHINFRRYTHHEGRNAIYTGIYIGPAVCYASTFPSTFEGYVVGIWDEDGYLRTTLPSTTYMYPKDLDTCMSHIDKVLTWCNTALEYTSALPPVTVEGQAILRQMM